MSVLDGLEFVYAGNELAMIDAAGVITLPQPRGPNQAGRLALVFGGPFCYRSMRIHVQVGTGDAGLFAIVSRWDVNAMAKAAIYEDMVRRNAQLRRARDADRSGTHGRLAKAVRPERR